MVIFKLKVLALDQWNFKNIAVIYDSVIWKAELKERIENFKNILGKTEFSLDWYFEEDEEGISSSYTFFIELQKFCFYSGVIARKFIESNRLSYELLNTNYKVSSFKRKTGKILTRYNFNDIESEYDLQKEIKSQLVLRKICDLFIHSFVFNPKLIESIIDPTMPEDHEDYLENFDIEGISGIYINTDYLKDTEIYYFPIETVIRIFEDVSKDTVVRTSTNNVTGVTINSRQYKSHKTKR